MHMNSIRKLLAGSLLAAGALATAAASISIATAADTAAATPPAGGMGGWHHHHRHGHGHWMMSKLNLTDAQKAQVKGVMTAAGPQMKSIHQQMRANSMKLSQMAPNDGAYAATVQEVSQANATLHAQMIVQREQVRASVFKILTPAQQQQLATMKAEMQAKMQARQQAWAAAHAQGTPQ
jgi:Spy/CpxP family protein refolding chaperone